jgi:hypothetical protein
MMRPVAALVTLLLLGASGSAAQDAERRRADTISGRVVADGAEPGEDAEVLVLPATWGSGQAQSATVAADGAFVSPPLQPGAYGLSVRLPGYVREGGDAHPYVRPGDSATVRMIKGGVITGTVTGPEGEPVVDVPVRATRIRDEHGRKASEYGYWTPRSTDDRGVYRMYGLPPGAYIVGAGGNAGWSGSEGSAYAGHRTVYHPSSPRVQAAEIRVAEGQEVTNVDIRYRAEVGRVVSGTVSGDVEGGLSVSLERVDGGTEASSFVGRVGNPIPFSFQGIADGEYEVRAVAYGQTDGNGVARRRVTVRGADVTDLRLALAPMLSIEGRVAVAAEDPARPEACRLDGDRSIREVAVSARPRPGADAGRRIGGNALAGENGAFKIRGVEPGPMRLAVDLPGPAWFVESVTRGAAPRAGAPPAAGITELALAEGKPVTDVLIRIGRGAAGVSGTVEAPVGSALPPDLMIYLVPADPALADALWRYYEVPASAGGSFEVLNLAPGAYWLVARRTPKDGEDSPAWTAAKRASLRKEAEASGPALELATCQRVTGLRPRLRAPRP